MHWYKRDPNAALAGMAELTMGERGAYNSLLDLLYSRDGKVPDDDTLVARMMNCHWREWRALKSRLMAREKVWIEGGMLCAKRVQDTLKEAAELSQKQSKIASKRWHKDEKFNEINETAMPPGIASTSTSTSREERKKEDTPSVCSATDLVLKGNYAYENGVVRLKEKDLKRWQDSFTEINVMAVLESKIDWLSKQQNWFFAAAGLLGKLNQAAIEKKAAIRIGIENGMKPPTKRYFRV